MNLSSQIRKTLLNKFPNILTKTTYKLTISMYHIIRRNQLEQNTLEFVPSKSLYKLQSPSEEHTSI